MEYEAGEGIGVGIRKDMIGNKNKRAVNGESFL